LLSLADNSVKKTQRLIHELKHYTLILEKSLNFEPVCLQDLLMDVTDGLRKDIDKRQAEVSFSDLPTVTGDAAQLRLLFQHLLSNALRYQRPDTPPQIVVTHQNSKVDDSDAVRIAVSDNGIGIPEAYQSRVFNLFERLAVDDKEADRTGLGLPVCQRIAKKHHAHIEISSDTQTGTEMTVVFSSQDSLPV
ncbi:MAG: PAS domain-containing sensor histidine kinase, partial [Gammaproteobacteria bacterium]|nr:PAS domain-containing sensor histidine kinase [Gammaproteobacteria bacterium]